MAFQNIFIDRTFWLCSSVSDHLILFFYREALCSELHVFESKVDLTPQSKIKSEESDHLQDNYFTCAYFT